MYQKPLRFTQGCALKAKDILTRKVCHKTKPFWYIAPMRIALYARVCTKDKGQDYENQLRELREFVARKASDGWVLVKEYVTARPARPPSAPHSNGSSKTPCAVSSI